MCRFKHYDANNRLKMLMPKKECSVTALSLPPPQVSRKDHNDQNVLPAAKKVKLG